VDELQVRVPVAREEVRWGGVAFARATGGMCGLMATAPLSDKAHRGGLNPHEAIRWSWGKDVSRHADCNLFVHTCFSFGDHAMKPAHHHHVRTQPHLEYISFSGGREQSRAIFQSSPSTCENKEPYRPAGKRVSIFISGGTVSSRPSMFKKKTHFRVRTDHRNPFLDYLATLWDRTAGLFAGLFSEQNRQAHPVGKRSSVHIS